jgi:hypothetical protein
MWTARQSPFSTPRRQWAALRVEKGKFQFGSRTVLLAGEDAAEGIFGLDHDDVAGIDREHRLGIGAVDIMEVALRRDGQLVTFAGLAAGEPALCHDRGFQPGLVGHRNLLNCRVKDGGGAIR